jgi:hypothetical protein
MNELLKSPEQQQEQSDRDERKRFESIWWAGVLIWLGLVLGGAALDILPDIGDRADWWPWIFVGVGAWSLALNSYRAVSTAAPNPSTWDWIWTGIFVAVAAGNLVDIGGEIVGAAVLVVIGLVILTRSRAIRH